MAQLQIQINSRQYQYLQQRIKREKTTLDQVLADIIEADMIWQQTLLADPVASLIGQINDDFDTKKIDEIVYHP